MRWLFLTLLLSRAHAEDLATALYPTGEPPTQLRMLVVEYDRAGTEAARWQIGDPADREWWPASTVKLFAAIAALEALEGLGFDPRATVAFDREGRAPYTRRFAWLVEQAITQSSNLAYDRLVQFVGNDALHADLLGPARGLGDTALQVPYSQNVGSLLASPRITLRQGTRSQVIEPREGEGTARCSMATCTSLNSLVDAMRRVMLHEELPEAERLRLSPGALALLRGALAGRGKRGQEVVEALDRAFKGRAFKGRASRLYHKPGYYPRWRSDVVFVVVGDRRWALALANEGSRAALDDPAERLARWLAGRAHAAL